MILSSKRTSRLVYCCCLAKSQIAFAVLGFALLSMGHAAGQTLEEQLLRENVQDLADAAKRLGDSQRGAILFFQPHMACGKCHSVSEVQKNLLGPNLAAIDKNTTDVELVESVLLPSKRIQKGYESVTILTEDGQTLSGLVVEKTKDKIAIRELTKLGEITAIAADQVETEKPNALSVMPSAQVNQLSSRQQFLDLVRYLQVIRDGGYARASELQPSATLLAVKLPEYEGHLDHAGLIRSWNKGAMKRGEAIYQRVCANCHGTKETAGSLPNSLRFAEGKFKNGADPYAIYQTLTHGYGLMVPQVWMVPSQKYEVIHYIREAYLREKNPTQYVAVDSNYLSQLPKGDTFGPEPSKIEPWSAMDYGPSLTHSYQIPGDKLNFAYKGVAVRLDPGPGGVARGNEWMIFDTDTLRMAATWSSENRNGAKGDNFIDWRSIQFNGQHQVHPRIVGAVRQSNAIGPGWADPQNGSFDDTKRVAGRDGRIYGPLPRTWGQFRGLYHHGQHVIFSYSIGATHLLESPRLIAPENSSSSTARILNIGPRDKAMSLQVAEDATIDEDTWGIDSVDPSRVAPRSKAGESVSFGAYGFVPSHLPLKWEITSGDLRLNIPAGDNPIQVAIWSNPTADPNRIATPVLSSQELDLGALTKGGPARWAQSLVTRATIGNSDGPFAVDVLHSPDNNPWLAQLRFTGLDFFDDGRTALCTWDGDVWIVEGPNAEGEMTWRRIASGMFQPLGLKIVNDKIHLTCRDQLTVLHDLNGDGETDFYECLNNDHQVTEHFHEFAMGLQTDANGDFYYAKSGRHALEAVVPHHGTLLKVSRDGSKTEILANGFRAANGVCLNPDGSFVVTDQEGFWNPKNRINWVTLNSDGKPNFYGNMFGYHDITDPSDKAMVPPLCWITNEFDRSPAELLWVDSERWGALNHSLLNLSYGYGKAYLVPHEKVNGQMQGGMIELPIPSFPTGVMRGRFQHTDGQLYLCGMFAWAGNATQPGGFYRLRATGKAYTLPRELKATKRGLTLTFTDTLASESLDPSKVQVKTWSLKRTANYGSKHFDEKELEVRATHLSPDGRTLTLDIPEIQPTWCMEIKYQLQSAAGNSISGKIHNTIHSLGE
jgi:putative heme-binding domain-containing protein